MATDKKRVIIYLDESDKQKLDAVAHDLGCSVSRLVGDLLIQTMPHLESTAQAIKMARTNPQKAIEMIQGAATTAQGDLISEMEKLK